MSCTLSKNPLFNLEDKYQTGMTIFSVNAVLLSLIFGNPSVLSLILNFAFFFIIFSFAYVKILEFVNVKEGEEEENEDFAFISEEKMQYWVNLVLQKVNKMLMKFKKNERLGEFYCEIKFVGQLFLLGFITEYLSIYTLAWIVFNGIFVSEILKRNSGVDSCEKYNSYEDTIKTKISQLLAQIPKYSDLKLE